MDQYNYMQEYSTQVSIFPVRENSKNLGKTPKRFSPVCCMWLFMVFMQCEYYTPLQTITIDCAIEPPAVYIFHSKLVKVKIFVMTFCNFVSEISETTLGIQIS